MTRSVLRRVEVREHRVEFALHGCEDADRAGRTEGGTQPWPGRFRALMRRSIPARPGRAARVDQRNGGGPAGGELASRDRQDRGPVATRERGRLGAQPDGGRCAPARAADGPARSPRAPHPPPEHVEPARQALADSTGGEAARGQRKEHPHRSRSVAADARTVVRPADRIGAPPWTRWPTRGSDHRRRADRVARRRAEIARGRRPRPSTIAPLRFAAT